MDRIWIGLKKCVLAIPTKPNPINKSVTGWSEQHRHHASNENTKSAQPMTNVSGWGHQTHSRLFYLAFASISL